MGTPVKIDDLARNMIKLSGLKPNEDIQIEYTGLRPGEKLFEERLMDEEGLSKTANQLINMAFLGYNDTVQYYDVSVEELWNPEVFTGDNFAIVNFLHGCYYSDGSFDHIDYSVNQYQTEQYSKKWQDNPSETGVTIDNYADLHYKVWCIKGSSIDVNLWVSLVHATLSQPFKSLFLEALDPLIDIESIKDEIY